MFEMQLSGTKIFLCVVVLLFLIALICTSAYLKSVADYKRAVKETAIRDIDISEIPDGVYVGEYDVNFIYAKVEVTVQTEESPISRFYSIKTGGENLRKSSRTGS